MREPAPEPATGTSPAGFHLLPPNQRLGWLPFAWLIYLPTFFISPYYRGDVDHWAATVVGALIFLVAYFRGHWERGRGLAVVAAVIAALGVAYAPWNMGSSVFFVYASSFAGNLENPRHAARGIAAITAVGLVTALAIDPPLFFWIPTVIFTPLIGAVNYHFTQVGRANARLRLAQREVEHLATVAERERIARDLHDVLGHTLSLITLKSELASKLADRDPARAAQEIRDVERISRTALAEVREAIRGYRATLDEEVRSARAMLEAAGIRGEFSIALGTPDRARDEVLALVLREAVTNAARHSGATTCRVTATQDAGVCTLVVEDDGRGGSIREGSGLRGMRERVEAMGGALAWEGARGMRIAATVPSAARVASRVAVRERSAG